MARRQILVEMIPGDRPIWYRRQYQSGVVIGNGLLGVRRTADRRFAGFFGILIPDGVVAAVALMFGVWRLAFGVR